MFDGIFSASVELYLIKKAYKLIPLLIFTRFWVCVVGLEIPTFLTYLALLS